MEALASYQRRHAAASEGRFSSVISRKAEKRPVAHLRIRLRTGDQINQARNETQALLALKNSTIGDVACGALTDGRRRIQRENLEEFVERRIGAHKAQPFRGPLPSEWVGIFPRVIENEWVGALGRDAIARQHSQHVE